MFASGCYAYGYQPFRRYFWWLIIISNRYRGGIFTFVKVDKEGKPMETSI